jgi:O-antigen/teichoic acid export membrane protein
LIIIKKFKQLTTSKFGRNVAIVATGTAMSQAIAVIFTPVITRLYGPEAFGLMGTFVSLGTVAASISALTYPAAMVLPKKDSDARDIAKLSVYVSIGTSFLATLVILIAGDRMFAFLGAQAISAFSLLIPLQMFFSAWLRIAQQWLIRKKQFMTTAKVDVIKSLIINIAQIVIGLFKPIAAVLIVFSTLGIGLNALMLNLSTDKKDKKKRINKQGKKQNAAALIQIARKYYDFPLYRAPVLFLEDASTNLPVIMLSAFFGPASAGFYVLGNKLLKGPNKLIGKSVSNVFYPKITEAAHKGRNLRQLIIDATLGLATAGIIPYAVIIIFGPWIFKLVFGAEWVMAGEYARWISFNIFFQFIARPSVVAIVTLGLQKGYLIYELISTAVELAALYAGFIIFKSDIIAVALFSVSYAISFIVLICWVIVTSKNDIQQERYSDE